MEKPKTHEAEISVEERLRALFSLQLVDSEIDKIKTLRGELPLEVQDLEDEIAGLETRLGNLREEVVTLEKAVSKKNQEITDAEALIKKYEDQQKNVRNNREYDSLSKEIEFQNLEIELFNKKIREFTIQIEEK
jgi:predicted  nucleic acid-binding Zn-ribbon protein